jgi:alpha-ribazole phosphatase
VIEIVVVRHGQTAWNATGRFQGRSDIALSDVGRIQAQLVQRALAAEAFDRAYASDLRRAMETAQIVLEGRAIAAAPEPRLREFDFGVWEGLTWEQIVARWPEAKRYGISTARAYNPEGGERFEDVAARVASFVEDLRRTQARRVLVVAHAGILHALLAVLVEEPPRASFTPAGISRFELEAEHARIVSLNDVAHLDLHLSP